MAPFYGWGSAASGLQPLQGCSLLFYHSVSRNSWYSFYQPRKDEMLSQPWSHPVVLNMGPLDWESSTLEISSLFLVNHLSFSAGRNYGSDSFPDIFHVIDILLFYFKILAGPPHALSH